MHNTTATPTPQEPKDVANDLLQNILAVLVKHIDARVESKVNEIMENHATLNFINDAFSDRIRDIAVEVVQEHEADYVHPSNDDISDTVATHIAHHDFSDTIRRSVEEIISDGDYPTEERVQEMIDEHDYEESVKEVLRNL
jgi:hypothetical protein